jgi:hypothetical protein
MRAFVMFVVSLIAVAALTAQEAQKLRAPQTATGAELSKIRQSVAKNEALVSLLRLEYSTKLQRPSGGSEGTPYRQLSRPYSHYRCDWAQNEAERRYYLRTDHFYSADELANSDVVVIAGERVNTGGKVSGKEWTFRRVPKLQWSILDLDFLRLGPRPFESDHLLSELLVPEYASVRSTMEQIDERAAYVVDVRRPLEPVYFASIWIDRERGVALRLEYYDEAPRAGSRKISSANSIKLYQVPNGGWIPIAGRRTFHFKGGEAISDIKVDTNSISIQAEDIPDTLFDTEAPQTSRPPPPALKGDKSRSVNLWSVRLLRLAEMMEHEFLAAVVTFEDRQNLERCFNANSGNRSPDITSTNSLNSGKRGFLCGVMHGNRRRNDNQVRFVGEFVVRPIRDRSRESNCGQQQKRKERKKSFHVYWTVVIT